MATDRSPAFRGVGNCSSTLFVITFLLWVTDVRAQDDPVDVDVNEKTIEEIVVTGSRIKRRDFSSPSPIATIDSDTIAFSGQATLEETLNQMPQVVPDFGRTSNNPGDGTARINLRGFGAGRTLVLLNARRLGPSGVGSAIDVNNLPRALVERVEIITGGASTVYGSDAVAGVVNFITRSDFSGLSIDASMNTTAENDAEAYDFNLAFGHNLTSGRGNITVYAGVHERKSLFASARELTRITLENNDDTGTLFVSGSAATPRTTIFFPEVDFGDGPFWTTFDPDGIPRAFIEPEDFYNFQEVNYLQTPLTRYNGGVTATFELTNGYELYLESSFSRNEVAQELAPVPAFLFFAPVNTDNPVLTPEAQQLFIDNYAIAPGLAAFIAGRRLLEVGPRIIEHERDYWRTVVGMRGELGKGWDIDGWVTYTKSSEKEFFLNDASASRLFQGLLVDPVTGECFDPSNGCVSVDIFGEGRMSEEAAAFLRITGVQNETERIQTLASVVVTGTPLDTWAGPLDMAFGLEWRSDDASFKADDVLFTGDTLGFRGDAPVEGTEKVVEIYTEAIIPLAQNASWADYLGLELGARYSEYDNAGGVWTYKAGGEWQPFGGLRFRGMHQRSVRAPNNLELFQALFTEDAVFVVDSSDDPCSASNDPVAAGNTEKCVLQGLAADQVGVFEATTAPVDFVQGGNPNLVPEVAKTWTIGAVITPEVLPNWILSIDYFEMEVTDSIGDIDAVSICFDPKNTSSLFCENITRDPNAGGNVVEIFEPQSNRGLLGTKGVDMQLNYQAELPVALSLFDGNAEINVNLIWTHMLENRWQLNPVTEIVDCGGFFGDFCAAIDQSVGGTLPENRVTTHINYISGPLSIHLTSRWIDGTTNAAILESQLFGFPEPMLAIPSIGSKHYLDLGFGYEFSDNLTARFGINNLTDTGAPNMANAVFTNNTDTLLFDVFGRSYFLSVSAQFLN
jgi:outer membrane receptor protein involved in Fe transport